MTSICAFNFAYKLKISIYNNLIKIFDFRLHLGRSRSIPLINMRLTGGSEDMLCSILSSFIRIKLQGWRLYAALCPPLARATRCGSVWLWWVDAASCLAEPAPALVPVLLGSEEPALGSSDHLNARHSHRSEIGGPGELLPAGADSGEYRSRIYWKMSTEVWISNGLWRKYLNAQKVTSDHILVRLSRTFRGHSPLSHYCWAHSTPHCRSSRWYSRSAAGLDALDCGAGWDSCP